MKAFQILALGLLLFPAGQTIWAQDAQRIITSVKQRQASLRSLSYRLQRTDTLVTGDVRTMSGKAIIELDPADKTIGFRFWAQRDGFDQQTIFDGRLGYVSDTLNKTYKIISDPTGNIFYSTTGGQMIVHDLIKLDTAAATGITASQDEHYYYLTINYPDLTEHDVSKRRKVLTIDKKSMLPVQVRKHQETLGKVQDLLFQVFDLSENKHYDFSDPVFIKNYKQEIAPLKAENPLSKLLGSTVGTIMLPSFENDKSHSLVPHGKVVLLDFWEAWCGPCIASMPKIQRLYDRYKAHGLQVYGIIHETSQLSISKKRAEKTGVTFPMLVGNEASKKSFHVSAIPLYILIGKDGKVLFLHEGFSDDLENEIQKALAR